MQKKVRVLFVDDSKDILMLVVPRLRKFGYEVVSAQNAVEAFRLLQQDHDFDIVVSDQQMPILTGADLFKKMRKAGIGVPFILSSSEAVMGAFASKKVGAQAFLPKPYDVQSLADLVSELTSSNTALLVS